MSRFTYLSTPAEQYVIQREEQKHELKLRRQLQQVKRTGKVSLALDELLAPQGFIQHAAPNRDNPYAHMELTEKGRHALNYLNARYGRQR